eukprot:jgi/Undpi1/8307/HiC_scaffold_25.g10776.m1
METAIGASLSAEERCRLQKNYAAAVKASTEAARFEDAASRDQQLQRATGPLSGGNMDYSDALRQAIAKMRPKWDFSTWDYRTVLACSAEETEAIHQYGVEQRRRACEIVSGLQDQRDVPEASRAQVEARAERKGAQAKESHAPPSSQTPLMQQLSSENAARSLWSTSLNSRGRICSR